MSVAPAGLADGYWVHRASFLAVALVHVTLLTVGFFMLAPAFGFPDILRAPAIERLARFHEEQSTIVLAYHLMTLSGLTQISLAVLAHTLLRQSDNALALGALIAGVLAGAWQAMGFVRWVIAIPYLADATTEANTQTIVLLEGILNHYAGMAVGEHLGFVGQGAWTALFSLAAWRGGRLPRGLAAIGVGFGCCFLLASLEQIGGPFAAFGQITTPLTAAWFAWLLGVATLWLVARGTKKPGLNALSWFAFGALLAGLVALSIVIQD